MLLMQPSNFLHGTKRVSTALRPTHAQTVHSARVLKGTPMRFQSWLLAAVAVCSSLASAARAEPLPLPQQADDEASSSPRPRFDAAASARQGMMLPDLVAPGSDRASRVTSTAWSGVDSARKSVVLRSFVDAHVYERLSVRAGVAYMPDPTARSAQPMVGLKLQLLRESKQGIDMSVGGFYRMDRFTSEEGLMQAMLALGGHVGKVGLFGNLVYGQDAEGDDYEAEGLFALLYGVTPAFQVGFESRGRFKLASTDVKRRSEPAPRVDVAIGPTLSYALGPVALLAQAGGSTLYTNAWRVGALAMGGLSASF